MAAPTGTGIRELSHRTRDIAQSVAVDAQSAGSEETRRALDP